MNVRLCCIVSNFERKDLALEMETEETTELLLKLSILCVI